MEEVDRIPPQTIMALLPFAEKQAIDKRLEEQLRLKKIRGSHTNSIFYGDQSSTKATNRILGERFLKWLQDRLASDDLVVNSTDNVGVRRIKEGVLISRSELLTFSELNQASPEVVEKQFREIVALYPTSLNERARQSSSLGGVAQVALEQWLLAYNPALIFNIGRMPSIFTTTPSPVNPQITRANLINTPIK